MESKRLFVVALSMVLIMVVGSVGVSSFEFEEHELESEERLWDLYERWHAHHTVSRSHEEKQSRFNVFIHNVLHVHNTNKEETRSYKLKLNKFADMTNYEFRTIYAGSKVDHHRMFLGTTRGSDRFMYENVSSVPPSVDWREHGAKDQQYGFAVGATVD